MRLPTYLTRAAFAAALTGPILAPPSLRAAPAAETQEEHGVFLREAIKGLRTVNNSLGVVERLITAPRQPTAPTAAKRVQTHRSP